MKVFYATASHEKCEVLLYFTTVTKKTQPPHRGLQQVRAVWPRASDVTSLVPVRGMRIPAAPPRRAWGSCGCHLSRCGRVRAGRPPGGLV